MELTPKSKREMYDEKREGNTPQLKIWGHIEPLLEDLHMRMLREITTQYTPSGGEETFVIPKDLGKSEFSDMRQLMVISMVLRAVSQIEDHGSFQSLYKSVEKVLAKTAGTKERRDGLKLLEKARDGYKKVRAEGSA